MHSGLRFLDRDHAWSAVFFSLIFSMWIIYADEVINSDGIRYMEAAKLMAEQGWAASFKHYSWPFYTVLIVATSKITFLDFEHAAYLINTILQAILAFVFVRCAAELGGDRKVTIAAAVLVLTHVAFNEFRDLIIRDFGYHAMVFTAMLALLRFHRTGIKRYGIAAGVALIVATLFRVEGVVFIVLAPLALLWSAAPMSNRLKNAMLVWLPAIAAAVLGGIVIFMVLGVEGIGASKMGESTLLIQDFIQNVTQGIHDKGRVIEDKVLNIFSRGLGTESVIAILVMMLLLKIGSASGLLAPVLCIWGLATRRLLNSINYAALPAWFMLINIVILAGFVTSQFFLTTRYAMNFSLWVALFAAFALAEAFRSNEKDKPKKNTRPWARTLIVIMLVYMLGDGLTSGGGTKAYIRDAASWLEKNASPEASLLANQEHMYYYSGRYLPWEMLQDVFNATRQSKTPAMDPTKYDYLAFKVGRKQKGFEEKLKAWAGKEPIYITRNERNDTILIFDMN